MKRVEADGKVPEEETPEAFVMKIIEDPRYSVMASMAMGNIRTNHEDLMDRVATWRANAEYYGKKYKGLVSKEADQLESVQRIQMQYTEIHRSLKQANLKYKATRDKRTKAETAERIYNLRADLGDFLLDILDEMKNRSFTPWADRSTVDDDGDDDMAGGVIGDTVSITDIRKTLKLESAEAVCKLGMTDLLAVLRIMDLMNYVDHSFFRGLWVMHPAGISHDDFVQLYGAFPEVKTGRGRNASLRNIISMRVYHYLGFRFDQSRIETANLDEYEKKLKAELAYVERQKAARGAPALATAAAAQAPASAS